MKPVALTLLLSLAGCAALPDKPPPGCHGPRRPANPYGSVLNPAAPAPLPAAATEGPLGACGEAGR